MGTAATGTVQSRSTPEEAGENQIIGRSKDACVVQNTDRDQTGDDDPGYDVKASIGFHDHDYNTYFVLMQQNSCDRTYSVV